MTEVCEEHGVQARWARFPEGPWQVRDRRDTVLGVTVAEESTAGLPGPLVSLAHWGRLGQMEGLLTGRSQALRAAHLTLEMRQAGSIEPTFLQDKRWGSLLKEPGILWARQLSPHLVC